MKKTVCELFAGVGGFRCGLNSIKTIEDTERREKWKTVWFNQWEPTDKKIQWAHSCYINRFGICVDKKGNDTTNKDISIVDMKDVPDHNLLVGGFPCQDYSVSQSLATSKGIEGKKGVLWWSIRDMLEEKGTPFVLLENVDRLLKSPAKQRGRDFGIILACFRDLGYTVEWRVINAAEYGYQQRRRRIFIFAYLNNTKYARRVLKNISFNKIESGFDYHIAFEKYILNEGFFAKSFPVKDNNSHKFKSVILPKEIGDVSNSFDFCFENSGIMKDGIIYTIKTNPEYIGKQVTLGDILEENNVDDVFFIPENRLYYTSPEINHSDESVEELSKEQRNTWQYLKGAKKLKRVARTGYEYIFSEGSMPMLDEYNKPARTMLTSEGTFGRSTHIVRDKRTGRIRLLTSIEMERIQGFPDDWTKEALVNGKIIEVPLNKRRFMMGNALVVDLIKQMEEQLSEIFEKEK